MRRESLQAYSCLSSSGYRVRQGCYKEGCRRPVHHESKVDWYWGETVGLIESYRTSHLLDLGIGANFSARTFLGFHDQQRPHMSKLIPLYAIFNAPILFHIATPRKKSRKLLDKTERSAYIKGATHGTLVTRNPRG